MAKTSTSSPPKGKKARPSAGDAVLTQPAASSAVAARMVAAAPPQHQGTAQWLPAAGATPVALPRGIGALHAMAELKAPPKVQPKAATTKPAPKPTVPPAPSNPASAALPSKVPTPSGEPDVFVPYPAGGMGSQKSASTGLEGDPDVAYAFTININNVDYGMFSEVAGISWKAEPIPVRVGGNNEYTLNMRGAGKFEPLTLKRGWFAASGEFFDLLKDGLAGSVARPNKVASNSLSAASIARTSRSAAIRFLTPLSLNTADRRLNSMSGQVGFEQLRFAYDYFEYRGK
jgi:phage tail-like protein